MEQEKDQNSGQGQLTLVHCDEWKEHVYVVTHRRMVSAEERKKYPAAMVAVDQMACFTPLGWMCNGSCPQTTLTEFYSGPEESAEAMQNPWPAFRVLKGGGTSCPRCTRRAAMAAGMSRGDVNQTIQDGDSHARGRKKDTG